MNSDDLKLNGAAVGTTHSAIIDSETRFLAGFTTDVESIAALLSSSNTISSSQEYTFDCTATHNSAHTVGGVNYELIVKDLAIRGTSWILVDVFMRKYRVKFDVKECMKYYSRCGGQRAVECGDDPARWTFHAERSSNACSG